MNNLLSVNWEITRRCNLGCIYCRVSGGKMKKNELSFEQAKGVVSKLAKANYLHIKFTGGEPLLKSYFWDLVKYVHEQKMVVSLFTNATLIRDQDIELFKKYIASVAVSLDSLDRSQNRKLGRDRTDYIIKNVERLRDAGIHTVLSSTITGINANQIGSLIRLTKELEISEIKINDFVMNGRAEKNKHLLRLSRPFKDQVTSLVKVIKRVFDETAEYNEHFRCECSNNDIFISYNGDVYPCVELVYRSKQFCLGNINSDNLGDILETNEKFSSQIKRSDTCAYSYLSSPHVSACLNRDKCPKSLSVYISKAKHREQQ